MKSFVKNSQTIFKYLLLSIAVCLMGCSDNNSARKRYELEKQINSEMIHEMNYSYNLSNNLNFMLINKIFLDTTPTMEDLIRFKRLVYIDSLSGGYANSDSNQLVVTALRQYITDYMLGKMDKNWLGLYEKSLRLYNMVEEYQGKHSMDDTLMCLNNPAYYQKKIILHILVNELVCSEIQNWKERYASKDTWLLNDQKIKLPSNVRL